MRIECSQEKIKEAISISRHIIGKNMTLPVLSCFLIETNKNNSLIIKSTNLDLGIEVEIPAKVIESGSIAVPGQTLSSFIDNTSDNEKIIKIEEDKGNVKVITSKNSGIIKTLSTDDFPSIPHIESDNKFTLSASDFVKGLKSTWYSSSISNIKPELSSVYIYCEDEFVTFVATDSFRLAEKRIKMRKSKDFGQILIPYKNIPEIIRVLEKINSDIEVCLEKNQISFNYNGIYLTSRVIDGVFPDYKQIIPKQSLTEIIVLKQDLINALKLSNVFSDKFNQVNINVSSLKKCEIKTKNNDIGENISLIDASIKGELIDINFNYKYIIDCFQSIDSDSVTLILNGPHRPMIISPISDKTFRYIVMPMNR